MFICSGQSGSGKDTTVDYCSSRIKEQDPSTFIEKKKIETTDKQIHQSLVPISYPPISNPNDIFSKACQLFDYDPSVFYKTDPRYLMGRFVHLAKSSEEIFECLASSFGATYPSIHSKPNLEGFYLLTLYESLATFTQLCFQETVIKVAQDIHKCVFYRPDQKLVSVNPKQEKDWNYQDFSDLMLQLIKKNLLKPIEYPTGPVLKIALADPLKQWAQDILFSCYGLDLPMSAFYDPEEKKKVRHPHMFAGEPLEIRRVLQILGTEIGRKHMGNNVWIDLAERAITSWKEAQTIFNTVVFVTDGRFSNEVSEFRRRFPNSATVVMIQRNQQHLTGVAATHASEQEFNLIRPDHVIVNDSSSLESFQKERLEPFYQTVVKPIFFQK